jgi:hypothetical protein
MEAEALSVAAADGVGKREGRDVLDTDTDSDTEPDTETLAEKEDSELAEAMDTVLRALKLADTLEESEACLE